MAECRRCDGVGRILVAHPDEELSPAAMEFGQHRVERTLFCPLGTIYDLACPDCNSIWAPPRLPYAPPGWLA